jgi:hypothetical protein
MPSRDRADGALCVPHSRYTDRAYLAENLMLIDVASAERCYS